MKRTVPPSCDLPACGDPNQTGPWCSICQKHVSGFDHYVSEHGVGE